MFYKLKEMLEYLIDFSVLLHCGPKCPIDIFISVQFSPTFTILQQFPVSIPARSDIKADTTHRQKHIRFLRNDNLL